MNIGIPVLTLEQLQGWSSSQEMQRQVRSS